MGLGEALAAPSLSHCRLLLLDIVTRLQTGLVYSSIEKVLFVVFRLSDPGQDVADEMRAN